MIRPSLIAASRPAVLFATTLLLAGCEPEPKVPPPFDESTIPSPTGAVLAVGQVTYRDTCARCHRVGKAGSPKMGDPTDWQKRIAKGTELLVRHAIEGYSGPAGDEMPPRGGREDLTDEQVAAAVAYLITHSQ